MNTKQILKVARANKNGFTANLNGDLINMQKGYAVSITNNNGTDLKQLVKNLDRAEPVINRAVKNLFVGGWRNEAKVFFLDFSLILNSRSEAVAIAKQFNQEAIFNFKDKSSIAISR